MEESVNYAFQDEDFIRCMNVLNNIESAPRIREATTAFLTLTNGNYFVADGRAAKLCQESKTNRVSYSGYSTELMHATFDPEEDAEVTNQAINILVTAINSFIKSVGIPDRSTVKGQSQHNELCTLLIQVLCRGIYYLTDKIEVPEYLKPAYDKCIDLLENGADTAYNNFIKDLTDLDNSSLIDFFNSMDPSEVFGLKVTTKPNQYYDTLVRPYRAEIKNYKALYDRWLICRNEYRMYTISLQSNTFFDTFGITKSENEKAQRRLYEHFQLCFNNDVNVQYLIQMLNAY